MAKVELVEEIIERLPGLTGAEITRLEAELRRECERRAYSNTGKGQDAPRVNKDTAPLLTEVLEYRPHEDGHLQLSISKRTLNLHGFQ
ncbi:MAG: hypothetical protein M3N45_09960 [Actinomycetota bacterium]|nr:hypothetical protein [Actinomycetota bacterium]